MIRTCDLYHPKVALYQTELRPDRYYSTRIHRICVFVKSDRTDPGLVKVKHDI